jgi:hypothetical protein
MKRLHRYFLFSIIFFAAMSLSYKPANDCSILHEGTFLYDGIDESDIVVKIKGDNHVEIHNGGKYTIESKLEWINECEYNMTLIKITIPDFPFGPGDMMNVKISKVEGKQLYYTATVKYKSWEGVLRKIK